MLGGLAIALLALTVVTTSASAQARVSITPAAGSESDEFTVDGEGLMPGLALEIGFASPEGNIYTLQGRVIVVDADGDFEFNFTPAESFAGSSKGTWGVAVCVAGTNDCVSTTFDIL